MGPRRGGRWALPLGAAVLLLGAAAIAVTSDDGSRPASSAEETGEETDRSGDDPDDREGGGSGAERDEAASSATEPPPEPEAAETGLDEAETPATDTPDGDRWRLALTTADDVLVFDDGMDGAVAVDVQTGIAHDLRVPQRASDQPYRLWRVGEQVAVGWGDIHLVSLHPQGPPTRQLPSARYFVPAADPDQLWLIDHPPGGDPGERVWSLVDADGEVLVSVPAADIDAQPIRGIPGGLAVRSEAGHVHLLDLDGQIHTDHLTDGPAAIADATSEHVVWCGDSCDELYVSTASGDVVATFGGEDVRGFSPESVWMSGDGERLVAVVMVDLPSGAVDRELWLYPPGRSSAPLQMEIPLGEVLGSWTLDGERFYFAVNQPLGTSGGPQLLGWAVDSQITMSEVGPRLSGLRDLIVLPRDAVDLPEVTR